jgi:hypothetical protein
MGQILPRKQSSSSWSFRLPGVTFFQTPRREPWGAKTFIVKDPDGNLLLFAGPAD